ncbi:hypothetical protein VXS06_14705 [Photobacterium toruni]|uniref:Uncharacterized protein n=1 Tax=Photobacterium toruni TaxID=1935446 RepID=A0ABU6L9D8_9GAMM|nr:hypothetical protein [Photobacterium toruni]
MADKECNTLLNSKGNKVPLRPTLTPEMIKFAVLDTAVCNFDEESLKTLADDIAECYSTYDCGYDLAKKLDDDHGYDVDSSIVDDMGCVISNIDNVLKLAEKDWMTAYSPLPPFEIGSRLTTWDDKGVITGINEYSAATYSVLMDSEPKDSTTRRLIKFEYAVLEEPAAK